MLIKSTLNSNIKTTHTQHTIPLNIEIDSIEFVWDAGRKNKKHISYSLLNLYLLYHGACHGFFRLDFSIDVIPAVIPNIAPANWSRGCRSDCCNCWLVAHLNDRLARTNAIVWHLCHSIDSHRSCLRCYSIGQQCYVLAMLTNAKNVHALALNEDYSASNGIQLLLVYGAQHL